MHMGLAFDTIPWRFTDKDAIAFSGQGRVPVLIDGDQIVFDSWTIANYLEDTYPDRPSLFGDEGGRAVIRFVSAWADVTLVGGILRLIATDFSRTSMRKTAFTFARHEKNGWAPRWGRLPPIAKRVCSRSGRPWSPFAPY